MEIIKVKIKDKKTGTIRRMAAGGQGGGWRAAGTWLLASETKASDWIREALQRQS